MLRQVCSDFLISLFEISFDLCSGGKGNTGQVMKVLTPAARSTRSLIQVLWENGFQNAYRLGYKAKVNLQHEEEAPGMECYLQHLPVFGVF